MSRPAVVDAHVHVGPPRFRPAEEYLTAMSHSQVAGAILVQQMGHTDNRYLVDLLRSDTSRRGGVPRFAAVGIAADIDDASAVLDAGCVGLRVPSGGLADGSGAAVFDLLDERAAVASVHGPFSDIVQPAFADLVRTHPRAQFRLEHLGWFRYGPGSDDVSRFDDLLALAELPQVSVMWSGFFLNSGTAYPYPDALPYLERCLEAYGSNRVMWSGDWNRAGLRPGEYDEAIDLASFWGLDARQLADVLGVTAARVFGLDLGLSRPPPRSEPATTGVRHAS